MSPLRVQWQQVTGDALTAAHLHDVLRLRSEVFVVEQRSVYQDVDGLDLRADVLHLLGRSDDALVACARLIAPGVLDEHAHIGRVLVVAGWRGRGLGEDLVGRSIALARRQWPGTGLALSAQHHLVGWYARFGFTPVGELFDDGGIAHQHMVSAP